MMSCTKCLKFARVYANQLRHRCPRPGDKWHPDELFLTMKRLFRKLLKGVNYVPRVMVTDQLGSYGTAKREKLPGVEHRQRRYLNNHVRHEAH